MKEQGELTLESVGRRLCSRSPSTGMVSLAGVCDSRVAAGRRRRRACLITATSNCCQISHNSLFLFLVLDSSLDRTLPQSSDSQVSRKRHWPFCVQCAAFLCVWPCLRRPTRTSVPPRWFFFRPYSAYMTLACLARPPTDASLQCVASTNHWHFDNSRANQIASSPSIATLWPATGTRRSGPLAHHRPLALIALPPS